jgi:hypothetical protein
VNSKIGIITLLAGPLLVSSALAETATGDVVDVASIDDGEGNARILFHWDASIQADHYAVRRATLKFDVSGESEARVLRLRIHPVTTPWNAVNVAWSNGWIEPGGDFDEEITSATDIRLAEGGTTAFLDVTNVIKATLETGQPSLGFIVTADPADGIGLKEEDLSRFEGLASASLDVSWRRTPPKPVELQQNDGDEN